MICTGVPDKIVFSYYLHNMTQENAKCDRLTFFNAPTWGNWNGGSPVFEYQLILSSSGENVLGKTFFGDYMVIFDDLEGGQTYNFELRARNVFGYGPFSDPLTIETPQCSRM